MDSTRVLVVYYSRSGTTRIVARRIRADLGCEIERITDSTPRRGLVGWVRSLLDVVLHRSTVLRPMTTDPADFDVVVVGTPVWNASVSVPVRAYLERYARDIRRVAFFCTYGGRGSARAFRQMTELCGREPVATLALREAVVDADAVATEIRAFTAALEAAPPPPSRVRPSRDEARSPRAVAHAVR